jgi:hypothetical protein
MGLILSSKRENGNIVKLFREGFQADMVDWQITAVTLYCEAAGEEITIMVYKDWSVKCTGYNKYFQPGRDAAGVLKKRGKQLNRALKCEGLECQRITNYKAKLLSEERPTQPTIEPHR